MLNPEKEAGMERKFSFRGYNEIDDLPLLYDNGNNSYEEVSLKAEVYLLEIGGERYVF